MKLELELDFGLKDVLPAYLLVHAQDPVCSELGTPRDGATKSFTSTIPLPPGMGSDRIMIAEDMLLDKKQFKIVVKGGLPIATFTSISEYNAGGPESTVISVDIDIEFDDKVSEVMRTVMHKFMETYVTSYVEKIQAAHYNLKA